MTDPDLFSVLERASEGIEPVAGPQHAAVAALARARVLRRRRRAVVAGAVSAVAVLALVVATDVVGIDRAEPPITTPAPVPTIADSAVQPAWDPRDARALPQRTSTLPTEIQPPSTSGPLPLTSRARLVVSDSQGWIFLLGTDGTWARTHAPSEDLSYAKLSDDGTMLAALGDGALWVTDVRDGIWRQLELPAEPDAAYWTGLGTTMIWRGNTEIVLTNGGLGGATVRVDGSEPAVESYGDLSIHDYTSTPDGRGLVFGVGAQGDVINEVEDGAVVRSIPAGALGRVYQPVAGNTRLAGALSGIPRDDRPTNHSGIVVLDRATYGPTSYLPIARTTYTPGIGTGDAGGVVPLAWLDDRTLMLEYATSTGQPWFLVAWDVESGDLSRVAEGAPGMLGMSVATDLVRD